MKDLNKTESAMASAFAAAKNKQPNAGDAEQGQAQTTEHQGRGFESVATMRNLNSALGGGYQGTGGEILANFGKVFKEVAGSAARYSDLQILNWQPSAVPTNGIVAFKVIDSVCAFAVLLVEATGRLEKTIEIEQGHDRIVKTLTTGDVYTSGPEAVDYTMNFLNEHLAQNGQQMQYVDAGCVVIPATIAVAEVERLGALLNKVNAAIDGKLELFTGGNFTKRITPELFQGKDTVIETSLRFGNETLCAVDDTLAFTQWRCDVRSVEKTNKQQNTVWNTGDVLELGKVGGFIDLVWEEPVQQASTGWGKQRRREDDDLACYHAQIIASTMSNPFGGNRLELQLLHMANMFNIIEGEKWTNCFSPKFGDNANDKLHDLSGIQWEAPALEADKGNVDFYAADLEETDRLDLIQENFHRDPIISLDIPEVGPDTWLLDAFAVLAENDDANAEAAIIDAADVLTDGVFSTMWDANQEAILSPMVDRVHLGTWSDSEGRARDLREINYLAMLNIGDGTEVGMQTLYDYAATFADLENVSVEKRLEQRLAIMRSAGFSDIEVTGYATRVTFNINFLAVLASAMHKAGINLETADQYGQQRRGRAQSANANMFQRNDDRSSGLFNNRRGSGRQQGNFGRQTGSRRSW